MAEGCFVGSGGTGWGRWVSHHAGVVLAVLRGRVCKPFCSRLGRPENPPCRGTKNIPAARRAADSLVKYNLWIGGMQQKSLNEQLTMNNEQCWKNSYIKYALASARFVHEFALRSSMRFSAIVHCSLLIVNCPLIGHRDFKCFG